MSLLEVQKNFSKMLSGLDNELKTYLGESSKQNGREHVYIQNIDTLFYRILNEQFFKSRLYIGDPRFNLYVEEFLADKQRSHRDLNTLGRAFVDWLKEKKFDAHSDDDLTEQSLLDAECSLHDAYYVSEDGDTLFASSISAEYLIAHPFRRSARAFLVESHIELDLFLSHPGEEKPRFTKKASCFVIYRALPPYEDSILVKAETANRYRVLQALSTPTTLESLLGNTCDEQDIEDVLALFAKGLIVTAEKAR